ncbi:FkbM family methyltransferase [Cordyceps javanica]|uniref:FkbM family methyltransferase n=1 Tax=Cordyceps javanica TaxID=43265 RepID=A0A545VLM7_9HYPO|nr:FkbM family methyltransferase [Cordyceps javanica]TQW02590.1 FkbM family methyltransferase [Cordyceps javanica]
MASVDKVQLAEDFSVYANPAAKLEVEFIYKEIFVDKCYDIASFPDDAFFVDAGGNIGLFSLFMKKKYPASVILAFEPAPATFSTFQRNMELHNISGVQAYQCGLGRENANMALTFFPKMPGNSTLYSEDKSNQMKSIDEEHPIAKLMQETEKVKVDIKRLSDVLSQVPELKRIDLLKVDVEGAELDVLRGLDDRHWSLVNNVVVELCDSKGDFNIAKALLESKGFAVETQRPDWAPEDLKMYMLIARRN